MSISEVLGEHSHAHSFIYGLWLLLCYGGRDRVACKAEGNCGSSQRKVATLALEDGGEGFSLQSEVAWALGSCTRAVWFRLLLPSPSLSFFISGLLSESNEKV